MSTKGEHSDEMYNQPSFQRRGKKILNSDDGIGDPSPFTIGPGDSEDNQYQIRQDNAYLNNNID